jgi:hypothetical protein
MKDTRPTFMHSPLEKKTNYNSLNTGDNTKFWGQKTTFCKFYTDDVKVLGATQ